MKIQNLVYPIVLIVCLLLLPRVNAVEVEVQTGDILLTRNFGGEDKNPTPGYYNHTAIVGEGNWVIESQESLDSVIAVPIWHFFDRYPEVLVVRPLDINTAKLTAIFATKTIGRRYNKYESVRPFWLWHGGDNCVSTVRRIYNGVTGKDFHWRVPDDLLKSGMFIKVAEKKDHEHYVAPKEMYKGMVKTPPKGPATR